MERQSDDRSFEYRANVKEKVKKLESSMLNPELEVGTTGSRKNKDWNENNNVSIHIETESSDEKPAVMDVETTQINSYSRSYETEITKHNNHLSVNNNQDTCQIEQPEPSVSVKGLLKKFTNGVVSVSQPFRRKSSVSSNDISTVAAMQSSTQPSGPGLNKVVSRLPSPSSAPKNTIQANEPTKSNTISILHKPAPHLETRLLPPAQNGEILLNKKPKPQRIDDSQTQIENISPKSNFNVNSFNGLSIALNKVDQAETKGTDTSKHSKLHKISSPVVSEIKEKRNSINSVQSSVSNTEEFPKPKPRPRNVLQRPAVDSTAILNPNNFASIVVMGPGRAGKSSIINHLLRQDLTPIHKQRPSTREILELTAKVKIESSTDLSTIRIIDIPGFENKDEDAKIFSTLISYLNDKDGLQGKSPTLVAVMLGFDTCTNPFYLEELVNFLKVISHYQTNFLDRRCSNFLFVVTYSTTMNTEDFKDASIQLSSIILQHSSITEPIITFHRENQHQDSNMIQSRGGILDGIKSLFKSLKGSELESAGHMILDVAFGDNYPNSIHECFISKRIPLRISEHPEVLKAQKSLQYIYLNIEPTEISTLLEIGWENVDGKLRQTNPSSLLSLQQLFQKHQIRSFGELPEEPLKVLNILGEIPHHNLAATDLLTETLQLRIPSCYPALFIGQGYDVSKDSVTHVSPFQFSGRLITSPVGLIPEEINCKVTEDREIVFRFFYTYEDYVLDRMKDLGIKYVTFPTSSPPVSTDNKTGYNIVKPNQEPTKTTTAKAMIEYRAFQLSLCGREDNLMEFKPQFWDTVSSLPDLDIKKQETVDCWREFFNYWGTHVVKSAFGGGSIQVNFRGKMLSNIFKSLRQDSVLPSDEFETSKVFQWITGDGLDFLTTTEDSKAEFLQGFDVDTSFQGGDMKFQQIDLTKLSHHKVAEVRNEWIQSLPLNPVILETNLILVPLSYFVREKSEGVATKMDVAFHYFYSNFMATLGKQSSCSIL